jgi:hypothetical protein
MHVLHEFPALSDRQLMQVLRHIARQLFLLKQRSFPVVMHLRDVMADVVGQVCHTVMHDCQRCNPRPIPVRSDRMRHPVAFVVLLLQVELVRCASYHIFLVGDDGRQGEELQSNR